MNRIPFYKIENDLFTTTFTPLMDLPGFFPGAGGFFHDNPTEQKRLIFFGTDFGTLKDYERLQKGSGENKNVATIRNLRKTIEDAGVMLKDCFLTNAVLCLRKGTSATEKFPIWKRYSDYVKDCAEWHRKFIDEEKPDLIVLMGSPHLDHFGKLLFPELEAYWDGLETIKSVYQAEREIFHPPTGPDVLLMRHPSSWHFVPSAIKKRTVEYLSKYK